MQDYWRWFQQEKIFTSCQYNSVIETLMFVFFCSWSNSMKEIQLDCYRNVFKRTQVDIPPKFLARQTKCIVEDEL